jgi:hypothetical protein
MTETWTLKISYASRLWADGAYLALSRGVGQYHDVEEVRQHGNTVTLTGVPSGLLHIAERRALDLDKGYAKKLTMEPKKG